MIKNKIVEYERKDNLWRSKCPEKTSAVLTGYGIDGYQYKNLIKDAFLMIKHDEETKKYEYKLLDILYRVSSNFTYTVDIDQMEKILDESTEKGWTMVASNIDQNHNNGQYRFILLEREI